ncbi:MAG: CARDB domain-containing protein, partial [Candidatus Kariarchaeaceae archaeon]
TENRGLTNGSRIRTTSPVLVSGQRTTEDIYYDHSFAYSILSSRMMGFEYTSPFDGFISLVSLSQGTVINVKHPGEFSQDRDVLGSTITLAVKEGTYINSTRPTNAAFISYTEGTSASMAVPGYLRGSNYIFDADVTAHKSEEIKRSYILIDPEQPTELEFQYSNGEKDTQIIFQKTKFGLNSALRSINSSHGKIDVTLRNIFDYGGITRSSTLQLIAAPEMRSGEIFATAKGYSSHLVAIQNNTSFGTAVVDDDFRQCITEIASQEECLSSRHIFNKSSGMSFSFNSLNDNLVLIGNNSAFGFFSLPGKTSHPMSASLAFLNIPLNTETNRENVTGILATWYRFPNLAVIDLSIEPRPHEEYTSQTIRVEVISNGSLPASLFRIEISIDKKVEVDETYDFLQVNETLVFEISKFISYGKNTLDISVNVDVDDQVNEINEEDNKQSFGVKIKKNIRLRWSIYGLLTILTLYMFYRFGRFLQVKRRTSRTHVDVILSFQENTDE